jgi:hypothetical protein
MIAMINQLKKKKKKWFGGRNLVPTSQYMLKRPISTMDGLLERILVSCQKKPTKRFSYLAREAIWNELIHLDV